MAYTIPSNISLDALLDHLATAASAADALGMTALAAKYDALYEDVRKARDARDADRRALFRAQAHVRVADAKWDHAVGQLSSHAYLIANKDAKAEPYVSLFGTIRANDAVKLGPDKARSFGNKLHERVAKLGQSALDPLAATLADAQKLLLAKDEARDAAEVKLAGQAVERVKWVQKVQHAVNEGEIEILTANPGRRDLVRAVLAMPRAPGKREERGDVETPGTVDDDG